MAGVGDIFSGFGSIAEGAGLDQAAGYAKQNARIVALSTKIQEQQTQRQVYQTIGAQKAEVGAAGFMESGSATDLLRSSVQQGSLQKSLVANQGLIDQTAWLEKATELSAQATAAKIGGAGSILGGIFSIFGG